MSQVRIPPDFIDANLELLKTGKYSDLVLECGDSRFHVHRAIVCPKSVVIADYCDGFSDEREVQIIRVTGHGPKSFARMINYFYTLDYSEDEELSCEELVAYNPRASSMVDLTASPPVDDAAASSSATHAAPEDDPEVTSTSESLHPEWEAEWIHSDLMAHARAYAIAKSYEILGMRELAVIKYQELLHSCWPPHDFEGLLETFFWTGLSEIPSLRRSMVVFCANHHNDILGNSEDASALGKHGELAVETFQEVTLRKRRIEGNDRVHLVESLLVSDAWADGIMKEGTEGQDAVEAVRSRSNSPQ